MLLGAAVRRLSSRSVRVAGLVSTTALLCTAVGSYGIATAASPYPPSSPPCALSWSSNTADGPVLVGSGYDTNQPVTVTLYPQARPLGSYPANASGAFEAPVDVPAGPRRDAAWVTATSPHRSCSVAPPSGGPPPTSTPPATSTPPTPARPTAPGGAGNGGSGRGATTSPYPPSGSSVYPPSGSSSGSSTGSPGAPSGSGAPSTPSASPTSTRTTPSSPAPNADTRTSRALGLSLTAIVVMAVLLLLAGGLGVLVLTRRSGS